LGKNQQPDLFQSTAPSSKLALSDQQRLDWLRLMRTPGIGAVTFRDLLNYYGTARNAIEQVEGRKFGKKKFVIPSQDQATEDLERTAQFGAQLVALNEVGYPRWLQAVEGAPPLLYVKGDLSLSQKPSVAIVGSRNSSAVGLKFAGQLAHELGQQGLIVTSGLARGIDAQAHSNAIQTGTIAVLGGGLDHIYPAQNERLYHKIAQDGLLVSERPLGFYAKAKDFPRRNRLISGISLGTLVIEAAVRSGSLTTARFAGEQGRQVFAVPGHPLDPRAAGTNGLIKDGAILVSKVDDILEIVKHQIDTAEPVEKHSGLFDGVSPEQNQLHNGDGFQDHTDKPGELGTGALRERLLDLLGTTPIERDSLSGLLNCPTRDLQILLLELDLEGRIIHHGHQKISLK